VDSIAYNTLIANLQQVDLDGASVRVRWKCPKTGRAMGESTASMVADDSVGGRVRASVKRSVASELIYGAARLIGNVLGGAVGRVVNNAVYTAAGDINAKATSGVDYSEASRQAAVVAAFESVRDQFVWETDGKRFIAR
jgi:hypothetical protein